MMIAAALQASASGNPVRVRAQHVIPSFLLTVGLLITVGYAPPVSARQRKLEEELGGGGVGGLLSGMDEEEDERRRDWARFITLFAAGTFWVTGAFLDVLFAFMDWLSPPPNASPQPTSGLPGGLLMMQVLCFSLAVMTRYLTVQLVQHEREVRLARQIERQQDSGGGMAVL
jgi:hypothetical protein